MQLQASVAALSLALAAFSVEASVPMTVYNQCSESIELYDNSAVEIVAAGGTTSRTLAEGFSGMFRNGVNDQATLAEFSVTGGFLWYDISIIPTGPGYCGSLEECKSVTGRTGYNTPMQITPSGCQTVTCLNDGCADAYQYPKDDTKTHACSDSTSVVLTFCPGGSGGSTPSSYESTQQQSAPAPTTAAPTQAPTQAPTTQPPTEAPTQAPTTQPPTQPPTTQPPTQPPTTQPPTQPPTEAPTTQPPTEAPTQPPTEAPTQPPTEAPTQPPTEAPTTQPPTKAPEVTYAASNSTSGDEEQAATVSPSKGTKSGLTTSTPAPAPATTAPVAQIVSAPSTSSGDSTQSANTQSSTSSGTDATTYIATGLGCCAVIAAVAVVAVARKKKQELDATEGKEYSQEDLMTPVTHINVL